MRTINRYFHGGGKVFSPNSKCLLKSLKVAQKVADRFTSEQWGRLKFMNPSNEHLKLLKIAVDIVRIDWRRKPRPRRKGSE